ncbi:hypothetical protein BDV93DRAFT_562926 [Ceratobasidium sp. AG-I]|nr:hypothetical protein BDV93DRAFT_562926 [Ceratobasidium sp. AG-I]
MLDAQTIALGCKRARNARRVLRATVLVLDNCGDLSSPAGLSLGHTLTLGLGRRFVFRLIRNLELSIGLNPADNAILYGRLLAYNQGSLPLPLLHLRDSYNELDRELEDSEGSEGGDGGDGGKGANSDEEANKEVRGAFTGYALPIARLSQLSQLSA